jgi:hypothetical protein
MASGAWRPTFLLVEQDLAGLGAQQARNGLQQSGLARAVGTDDGHDLAGERRGSTPGAGP